MLKFLHSGCGCSRGAKGAPCSKQFEEETVLYNLHNCIELTKDELDLVVASIHASIHPQRGHWKQEKQKSPMLFSVSVRPPTFFIKKLLK